MENIFGIRKFDSVTELFKELNKIRWDDTMELEAFSLGYNSFLDKVMFKIEDIYSYYLTGKYSEEKFKRCLGLGYPLSESDLLDFEFAVYFENDGCFYTNTNEDRFESHTLNDTEKDIYLEIYEKYNLGSFIMGVVKLITEKLKEDGDYEDTTAWYCSDGLSWWFYDTVNEVYTTMEKKNELFIGGYEIKLPKITQGKYRIFIDPNIQTEEEKDNCFGHLDIDCETREEALVKFKEVYEQYRDRFLEKGNDLETWNDFVGKWFYIRDNSTGEEIQYNQINNE